jgi:hypothetical protein
MGNCIADRNIKSFVLALTYASIYGFVNAGFAFVGFVIGASGYARVLCFISGLYCVGFSTMFATFAWTTLQGSMRPLAGVDELRTWGKLLGSFGEHWWERIVPIQRRLTPLAWQGVTWGEAPRFI